MLIKCNGNIGIIDCLVRRVIHGGKIRLTAIELSYREQA